jgi:formiminoglutamase
MSLSDFFSPIDLKKIVPKTGFYSTHMGSKIEHYSVDFPDLDAEKIDIAIIGVLEDRNATGNAGCALGPDYVREKLYSLYEGSYKTKIVDLGNIKQGAAITDTYFAVKTE